MSYSADIFVADEIPTTAKWNKLWNNDASFNDGTGIGTGVIGNSQLASGVPVQVVSNTFPAVATGTTSIPFDDTAPQITEGDEYMNLAITPKASTNTLVIIANAMISNSGVQRGTQAFFQDSTASAKYAETFTNSSVDAPITVSLVHSMAAGTTSPTTIRYRVGREASGIITFNGNAGARLYGTTPKSSMTILEFKS